MLTLQDQRRTCPSPPLARRELVIFAELSIEPASPRPSPMLGISPLLAFRSALPDSLEEPGSVVHLRPDRLDDLERDWIPINQIKVRHFTKTGSTLTA